MELSGTGIVGQRITGLGVRKNDGRMISVSLDLEDGRKLRFHACSDHDSVPYWEDQKIWIEVEDK